jgi:hypothetical protein
MKMHIFIIAIAIFLLFPYTSLSEDLYSEKVSHHVENGKDLIMEFNEIERHPKFSIVNVKHSSGASVPSIMFVVKGCYEIAKIRGVNFFVNLKEWRDKEENWVYKIGFTPDDKEDPYKYFGNDIDTTKDLSYFSVKQYSLLFEKK